jgi:hypothetical protein
MSDTLPYIFRLRGFFLIFLGRETDERYTPVYISRKGNG